MTDPGPAAEGEPVGSLGEEAAQLLAALSGWAREVDGHLATGGEDCTWCPVCRAIRLVRASSPEVRAHLVDSGVSLLHAAAGLLAAVGSEGRTERRTDEADHADLDPDPADPPDCGP